VAHLFSVPRTKPPIESKLRWPEAAYREFRLIKGNSPRGLTRSMRDECTLTLLPHPLGGGLEFSNHLPNGLPALMRISFQPLHDCFRHVRVEIGPVCECAGGAYSHAEERLPWCPLQAREAVA